MPTTWSDLCSYVNSSYTVLGISPYGQLNMRFQFPDGRRQSVFISRGSLQDTGDEWVQIESVIGLRAEVNLNMLLDHMKYQLVGGLAKNEEYITLRHSMRLADMAPEDIDRPLSLVVSTADYLEASNGRPDRY